MNILNYFFIGFAFTFLIDLLWGIEGIKNHPKMKYHAWGWNQRMLCVIIWPISSVIFLITFFKTYLKK